MDSRLRSRTRAENSVDTDEPVDPGTAPRGNQTGNVPALGSRTAIAKLVAGRPEAGLLLGTRGEINTNPADGKFVY